MHAYSTDINIRASCTTTEPFNANLTNPHMGHASDSHGTHKGHSGYTRGTRRRHTCSAIYVAGQLAQRRPRGDGAAFSVLARLHIN